MSKQTPPSLPEAMEQAMRARADACTESGLVAAHRILARAE